MNDRQMDINFDPEEPGAARSSDPETSHDAAKLADAAGLRALALSTLAKARTGLNSSEIAYRCSKPRDSISPRMRKLVEEGLVYDTGQRRGWHGAPSRPASPRLSIVWQLTALRDLH